jgi:hypothetical protein
MFEVENHSCQETVHVFEMFEIGNRLCQENRSCKIIRYVHAFKVEKFLCVEGTKTVHALIYCPIHEKNMFMFS